MRGTFVHLRVCGTDSAVARVWVSSMSVHTQLVFTPFALLLVGLVDHGDFPFG